MPVSEVETAQVFSLLPPTSLLRRYVTYAARCTDAPLVYHLAGGLHLLAATAPVDFAFPYGSPLYTNLFSLLVGTSRVARKSSAVKIPRLIMKAAMPSAVCEVPGSREGLIESVRQSPRQTIFYEEFGDFLASTKDGYLAALKMTFNQLFDAAPIGRALSKKREGEVLNPRVSVYGGVTPDYLESDTTPTDWTGGFFSRFLVFSGVRERMFPTPPGDNEGYTALVQEINARGQITKLGECMGFDQAAQARWESFYAVLDAFRSERLTAGAVAGAHAMTLKIAMLLALDYGQARVGGPWRVTMAELQPAMEICTYHVRSVLEIGDRLSLTRDMRDRRVVLERLSQSTATTLAQIIAGSKLLKRRTQELLESLIAEGAVQIVDMSGVQGYVRVVDSTGRKLGAASTGDELAQFVAEVTRSRGDSPFARQPAVPLASFGYVSPAYRPLALALQDSVGLPPPVQDDYQS